MVADEDVNKIWEIYIGEARRYDEKLLEGWKSDMDGILLFSALYSASLTAFIIESYKNLQDNPADNVVALLAQISQQLSAVANGTTLSVQGSPAFEPSPPSLICNVLWFLSLVLALSCSLLATFVQQWTQDFISKTHLKPSPFRQARAISFLYGGLRQFEMHTFVDVIPILLHISLFFLAGLVSFLVPVNRLLAYVMASFLGIFLSIYIGLTVLPLMHLNAPYRTPLSGPLWRLGSILGIFLACRHGLHPTDQTLSEAMLEKSLQECPAQTERDQNALIYSLKMLTDDPELLPFIEGIPTVLGFSSTHEQLGTYTISFHHQNVALLLPLLGSFDLEENILFRISQFAARLSDRRDDHFCQRGSSACSQALWSLALMLLVTSHQQRLQIDQDDIQVYCSSLITLYKYYRHTLSAHPSALAAMRLSWLFGICSLVDWVEKILIKPLSNTSTHMVGTAVPAVVDVQLKRCFMFAESLVQRTWPGPNPNLRHFVHSSWDLRGISSAGHPLSYHKLMKVLRDGALSARSTEHLDHTRNIIADLKDKAMWKSMRLDILMQYLLKSGPTVAEGKLPYWFEETCNAIYNFGEAVMDSDELGLVADHYTDPLLSLPVHLDKNSDAFSHNTDIFIKQCMKLFFSVTGALWNTPMAAESRRFVTWYFHNRIPSTDAPSYSKFFEWPNYMIDRMGDCIVKGLRDDGNESTLYLMAAWKWTVMCSKSRLNRVSLSDLWVVFEAASPVLRQDELYPVVRNVAHQAVLDDIIYRGLGSQSPDLSVLECALLREYLPDEPPASLETTNVISSRGSLKIAITSQRVALSSRHNICSAAESWVDSLVIPEVGLGEAVDETRQEAFAHSVANLVGAVMSTKDIEPDHSFYRALDVVWTFSCCYDDDDWVTQQWYWVTSPKGAKILLQAIEEYEASQAFRNIQLNEDVLHPRGRQRLRDRCRIVLEASVSSGD
ncbi:hypothetical protein D9758_006212 [Tetrapyrgos nigripes]|uniref:DUF6535 domain-containing protein n=1 Tax=Tetrapyrgos nigripes TaxID=182062 RepID=A0A8H5LLE0_9AGAR|nr:hypothetical protein D9758_006212 [Tetrapyrgos nigripes]